MKYVPLKRFASYLEVQPELFWENKALVFVKLHEKIAATSEIRIEQIPFTLEEILKLVSVYSGPEILVYDQWIEANKAIKTLLIDHKLSHLEIDNNTQAHRFYSGFQSYVSLFLISALKTQFQFEKNAQAYASFLKILTENERIEAEHLLIQALKREWDSAIQNTEKESFNSCFVSIFSADYLSLINQLSKVNYAFKTKFIDDSIALLKHPKMNFPFALWMTKQLNFLQLNTEHELQLKEISKQVRIGNTDYVPSASTTKKTAIFSVKWLFLLIPIGAMLLIYFQKDIFQNTEEELSKKGSSFGSFTPKERQKLDSLIQSFKKKKGTSGELVKIDTTNLYLHLTPVNIGIVQRIPFRNKKMENIIQAAIADYENDQLRMDCNELKKESTYIQDFNLPKGQKGEKTLFLKNESAYLVWIYIFQDQAKGNVQSYLLKSNSSIKVTADSGDKLIFLPGNELATIHPNANLKALKIKHQFCELDANYENGLYQSYSISSLNQAEIKVLLNSNQDEQFYLVDLYQALQQN